VRDPHEAPAITSRRNPLVARFREAAADTSSNMMLLDGPHLVGEALDANVELIDVAFSSEAIDHGELAALHRRVPHARLVSASVMGALSPTRSPAGVVALARRPADGTPRMFAAPALIVIAIGVQDPGNVGAMLRSAEAGGATGVIITSGTADPFGWKALRGAMGSAFRMPVARAKTAEAAAALARAHGLRVVATVGHGGLSMAQADLRGPLALVVGGEGAGLPPSMVEGADLQITIPMEAPVESLNVAVATALLVFECRRQRESRSAMSR
jgi:TrmH family RNA methyltransferase